MTDRIVRDLAYVKAETYNGTGKPERYHFDIPASTVADFNKLYYYLGGPNLEWLGVPMIKCPTDLLAYQQLIWELKPEVIIETGTLRGGSALFFATILDAIGKGRIYSIDIEKGDFPKHPRITYVTGSSTEPAALAAVITADRALVILDSDHRRPHVLRELLTYAPIASYIVVEDGNINGHPVRPDYGEGPYEAVEGFLATHKEWTVDRQRIPLLTACPNGYLRRV